MAATDMAFVVVVTGLLAFLVAADAQTVEDTCHSFAGGQVYPQETKRTSGHSIQWSQAVISKAAPDWNGTAVINGEFKDIKLSDFKGKYLVFFFYPLDLLVLRVDVRIYNVFNNFVYLRKEWLELIRTSILQRLTFVFVPGHAGVCDNERSDTLAANAAITDGRGMDPAYIISALRERGWMEVDALFMNSFSGAQVKCGIARRERHLSDKGRVINQIRTGVISSHTLGVLLRMGSECVWTCTVCNEGGP